MTVLCAYCGAPAAFRLTTGGYVQLVTCSTCADLPPLDPAYGLAETIARGAYPALDLEARAPSELRTESP
jgi:hypothetical protein